MIITTQVAADSSSSNYHLNNNNSKTTTNNNNNNHDNNTATPPRATTATLIRLSSKNAEDLIPLNRTSRTQHKLSAAVAGFVAVVTLFIVVVGSCNAVRCCSCCRLLQVVAGCCRLLQVVAGCCSCNAVHCSCWQWWWYGSLH